MSIQITKLDGLKYNEDDNLIYCDPKDKDACEFRLSYIGSLYSSTTIAFDSLYKAEEVEQAIHKVFEAGKKQTKIEFNQWIKP